MNKSKTDIRKLRRYRKERDLLHKIWWFLEKVTWRINNLNKSIENLRVKLRFKITGIHNRYE